MIRYFRASKGYQEVSNLSDDCWISVESPNGDDIEFLVGHLGVPLSFLHDIEDKEERPRFDDEDGWRLAIISVPVRDTSDESPYSTVPLGILTNDTYIVSVCNYDQKIINDFVDHTRKKGISVKSKPELILRLVYSSTVWFLKYLKLITWEVHKAENEMEHVIKNEELMRLMHLQRAIIYFNTSIRANEILLAKLENLYYRKDEMLAELLEDVQIELKQAYNTSAIYTEILKNLMQTTESVINNNVNIVMRRMTSVSIVLMLPTLIASFYGMNVDVKLDIYPYAFFGIVLISVLLSGSAFWVFKKIHWF